MKEVYLHQNHSIEPVWDEHSNILILGSFPSVKSRELEFFYGHPQNRFWKVLAMIFEDTIPSTIVEKKAFLIKHHIAVWDVIGSCDIIGSSDSSIKNVIPNNIQPILEQASICRIYANGNTAYKLYQKYIFPVTHREAILLPSTSPANASYSLERLCLIWKEKFILMR
ncbi:MAG: DNA-deoxyinosine glycosylase [Prevotella sp.]|nr:DNA-deoxyinosine glycosylase [Staphylococcus sp.]MCM1349847.1 DNA-deoxyinosine glycosylase [Prevotella sp.]